MLLSFLGCRPKKRDDDDDADNDNDNNNDDDDDDDDGDDNIILIMLVIVLNVMMMVMIMQTMTTTMTMLMMTMTMLPSLSSNVVSQVLQWRFLTYTTPLWSRWRWAFCTSVFIKFRCVSCIVTLEVFQE